MTTSTSFEKTLRSYPQIKTSLSAKNKTSTDEKCFICGKIVAKWFAEVNELFKHGGKKFCCKSCLKGYLCSSLHKKIKDLAKEVLK